MHKVLHLDIEGGWGGSSKSLYNLVKVSYKNSYKPFVIHGQKGPATEWYKKLQIKTKHFPEIVSYAPREKRGLFSWKEIITFSGYENTEFKNAGWKHLFEKTDGFHP